MVRYLFCLSASESFRTSFSDSLVPSNSTAVTDALFSRSAFLRSALRDPVCPMLTELSRQLYLHIYVCATPAEITIFIDDVQ